MFKSSSPQIILQMIILGSTLAHTPEHTHIRSESGCRCFPADQCWPDAAEWAAFNETIHGRLIATVPIASVCHHDSFVPYDAEKCRRLQDDWLLHKPTTPRPRR